MKCSLCGLEFSADQGRAACASCVLVRTCNLIRCPNCGFEMPIKSKLEKFIKKWRRKKDETN
ncbi:MAG: hypothetical protein ACE5R6_19880 [Candidatus Heimdallarchaeota archaeon]